MPELVRPALRWAPSYRQALTESALLDEAIPWDVAFDASEAEMAQAITAMASGIWGPAATEPTQLLCWWVDGDAFLARISLRFQHLRDSNPTFYAGHGDIGYDVRPSMRGQGVGTDMLRAMLTLAQVQGYPEVLITCDAENTASRRVLEKAGGIFLDEYDDAGELVLRYAFPL